MLCLWALSHRREWLPSDPELLRHALWRLHFGASCSNALLESQAEMCNGTPRAAELSWPKQGYLWLPKRGCNLLCYPQISAFKSQRENATMLFDLASSFPTLLPSPSQPWEACIAVPEKKGALPLHCTRPTWNGQMSLLIRWRKVQESQCKWKLFNWRPWTFCVICQQDRKVKLLDWDPWNGSCVLGTVTSVCTPVSYIRPNQISQLKSVSCALQGTRRRVFCCHLT